MSGNPLVPSLDKILPKKKTRMQMHISAVNMLNTCGQQFFYRYVLGIKRPPSAYLIVGTATDESVNKNLDHKIETGELLKRKDVIEIGAAKFDAEQKATPIELEPDEKREGLSIEQVLSEAKEKTVDLAGLHYDTAAPVIKAKFTQRKFSINMDAFLRGRAKELHEAAETIQDRFFQKRLHAQAAAMNAAAKIGMDFAGEQDIVEEYEQDTAMMEPWLDDVLVIRDTKTSAKSPTKSLMDGSKDPGIADDSEQLTAYAVASQVIDGRLPDLMVLDYLVRTPKDHKLKYVPTKTTRSLEDTQVFLNRFANAVQAYKSGTFVPIRQDAWQCSQKYCGFWDRCPYAKRPKQMLVNIEPPK